MTNEKKAREITQCVWFPHKCTEGEIQNMLVEMAEWKDEQFTKEKQQLIDEACKWLKDNEYDFETADEAIIAFKKAMKGE